jgi:Ran GTPase-activating protein (RanGAP) involved in mRNA processing and transport
MLVLLPCILYIACFASYPTCCCFSYDTLNIESQIDLSQRGLVPSDARLVKMALLQNSQLSVLKLGYNNLGDKGVQILAAGISQHRALESLDLGFNNIGDEGCRALARAIPRDGTLHTLYLAGNLIGEDGALAIADVIRKGSSLRHLYMTGNRLGADGITAITEAILEDELRRRSAHDREDQGEEKSMMANGDAQHHDAQTGMQKLFLGGTGMGPGRCKAFSRLLGQTTSLKVLSLPNCDIGDETMAQIASSIKSNRESLVLESLQLSFNRVTCKGLECLANAIWGSRTLKELLLDNNEIGDRGAQQVAAVLPFVKTLETLDVGFNLIKSSGMKLLMKAATETQSLQSLSVSGNKIDTSAAKAVAFALAYNRSLISLSLVHCSIGHEGQRHISAGIVSNSRTALRELTGFDVGPVIVTLGFPPALEHWTNQQILNFIHLMWENKANDNVATSEEEKTLDPLHFLSSNNGNVSPCNTPPLQAAVVVEVAKRAFETLVEEGVDVFSRRPGYTSQLSSNSPIAGDNNIVVESMPERNNVENIDSSTLDRSQARSFVVPPQTSPKQTLPDPSRKKRIVEWLCSNIQHLNKLAQQPFNSAELGRLHQHFFTPVVNETGGSLTPPSPDPSSYQLTAMSVPNVSKGTPNGHPMPPVRVSVEDTFHVEASVPTMHACQTPILSSFPNIKRKGSYRFLGDAVFTAQPQPQEKDRSGLQMPSVSMMIEGGPTGHSLPPKTKRARRNRTRISFLPRVKDKLDSYLDVCHEKALITMRQMYYVEQAILSGKVNPVDPAVTPRTHLTGDLAADAEMIVVDMM